MKVEIGPELRTAADIRSESEPGTLHEGIQPGKIHDQARTEGIVIMQGQFEGGVRFFLNPEYQSFALIHVLKIIFYFFKEQGPEQLVNPFIQNIRGDPCSGFNARPGDHETGSAGLWL